MKEIALFSGLLSGVCGVVSAVAFLCGSKAMPWELQTYDGNTDPEKAFRATAQWWNTVGLFALGAAFVLAALSSLASYFVP